jgi:hypothetical protein
LRTEALVEFTVAPRYEVLYQAADPNAGTKARTLRRRSVAVFVPIWALLALIEFLIQQGQPSEARFAALVVLLSSSVGFAVFFVVLSRSIAHPTPPPAITKEGVLLHRWNPFGRPSPVEHRFEGQRTVKGYRAGQDTVIELYPPNGRPTRVAVFDPEGRVLKFVREIVLKSGAHLGETAESLSET